MTQLPLTLVGRLVRRARRTIAPVALAVATCSSWAEPLDDMRRLVEGSQFEQAYQTALAHPQLIGDVHFDFLYGVAAINVGRVPEGLLALERHLSAVPANDRARLELARGYFLLGEYTRARAEFEFVLRYNPPAGVRANIAGFLQAMQTREPSDRRASARFYAEVGGGHDSNINAGTFRESYLVGSQVFASETSSIQVADDFAHFALGGERLLRVSNRLSVFVGADLDHRVHSVFRIHDLSNGSLYVGFSQLSGQALWRATLATSQIQVGGQRYRNTLQLNGEANFSPTADSSLLLFGQFGVWRHATEWRRDAHVTSLGLNYSLNLSGVPWVPVLGARIAYAQEDNVRGNLDFSKKGPLLRVFAAATPLERLRISAGLTGSTQKYGGFDVLYRSEADPNEIREDRSLSADVLASYAIDANWSLRVEALWSINHSNQDLYDTERKSLAAKLRYQY